MTIDSLLSYKYTAIIIEPRKHHALEFVLNNALYCLSSEWKIILFHGNDNVEYVNKIAERLNTERLCLIQLNISNLDLFSYSGLLVTKSEIYDSIFTEHFLVFQTDSMFFKRNAEKIYDFLEYDYVGSPWLITNYTPTINCGFIGNGGCSLRRKSKMIEIIETIPWDNQYEDLYFSTNYPNIHVSNPEYTKATNFCVDEVFSETPFACHKPWVHNYYNVFKTIYPECEILRKLNSI